MLLPALSKAEQKAQGIKCMSNGKQIVFPDEHPDSINDGAVVINPMWPSIWENDMPASYHTGACGISFADEHSEIHKWLESTTRRPVQSQQDPKPKPGTSPVDRDISYMHQHNTARLP